MNCGSVKEKLIDLVYGELSPAEDRALREHCHQCLGCGEELAALQETLALTRKAPEPELPPFLNARVLAHVREQAGMKKKPASRWAWILRPQVTMAAVAMIAASLVIVIMVERGPELRSNQALIPLTEEQIEAARKDQSDAAEAPPSAAEPLWMETEPPAAEAAPTQPPASAAEAPMSTTPAQPPASAAPAAPPAPAPARPQTRPALVPPARDAAADEMRREKLAPADQPKAKSITDFDAMARGGAGADIEQAPGALADNQTAAAGRSSGPALGSAATGSAAPSAAPAPAPAPPAVSPPSPSPPGIFGFRQKATTDTTRKTMAAPPAPAAGSAAPAPAPTTAAPAPPKPPAPAATTTAKAKEEESDRAASAETNEAAPAPAAVAKSQPSTPSQWLAAAAELEKQGKYAEALSGYQRAASGLGYAPGKQPPCSASLRSALEGMARCQSKLGRGADAAATTAAARQVCTEK